MRYCPIPCVVSVFIIKWFWILLSILSTHWNNSVASFFHCFTGMCYIRFFKNIWLSIKIMGFTVIFPWKCLSSFMFTLSSRLPLPPHPCSLTLTQLSYFQVIFFGCSYILQEMFNNYIFVFFISHCRFKKYFCLSLRFSYNQIHL